MTFRVTVDGDILYEGSDETEAKVIYQVNKALSESGEGEYVGCELRFQQVSA